LTTGSDIPLENESKNPQHVDSVKFRAYLLYQKHKTTLQLLKPTALQRTNTENSKQIFPGKELCGHSPNFHIHVSVSDLHIPTIDGSAYSAARNTWTDPRNI
jgi:hypothetical protein